MRVKMVLKMFILPSGQGCTKMWAQNEILLYTRHHLPPRIGKALCSVQGQLNSVERSRKQTIKKGQCRNDQLQPPDEKVYEKVGNSVVLVGPKNTVPEKKEKFSFCIILGAI
jgi:hypothetical protein